MTNNVMTKNINMSDMLHTLFYKQLQVTNNCHVNAKENYKKQPETETSTRHVERRRPQWVT